MRSLAAILAVALAPLACASPPPAAAPAAEPAAAAARLPIAAPASPPPPPSASVVAVEPGKEGAASARAKVVFTNPSGRPCRFAGYTLSWGSSKKVIKVQGFTVPPGETRERWIKLAPDDGDLRLLTPESGHVDVDVECEGSP